MRRARAELSHADEEIELFAHNSRAVIYVKAEDRYFEAEISDLPSEISGLLVPHQPSYSRRFACFTLVLFAVLALTTAAIIYSDPPESLTLSTLWVLAGYGILSVVIHEAAHIIALRHTGRRIDKVGFKMHYWFFPAVYVRMNQSHLLGRDEKVVVHAAGIVTNMLVNSAVWIMNSLLLQSYALELSLKFISLSLLANALPLLKSDGYRVVLALADINEKKNLRDNPRWVIAMQIISIGIVLASALRLFLDLYGVFIK